MQILPGCLNSILMLEGLAWGLSFTRLVDAVIVYVSRSLTKAKCHYPTHKLEFLSLKWAVGEKFNEYLHRSTPDVYTDNNTLTYVLTTAKLDTASH